MEEKGGKNKAALQKITLNGSMANFEAVHGSMHQGSASRGI